MKEVQEFISAQMAMSDYWLARYVDWIRAYLVIHNTLYPKPIIQTVLQITDDEAQLEACEPVISELNLSDGGCGSVYTQTRTFIRWAILDVHQRKLARLSAEKRSRLAELEREKKNIEAELNNIKGGTND